MEDIDARIRQRQQPFGHFVGIEGNLRVEILLLPLRKPDDQRNVRPEALAYGLDHLDPEPGPLGDRRATPVVTAGIEAAPVELIDQIAVGRMDLGGVEAQLTRSPGGGTEGGDGVGDVLFGHRLIFLLARAGQARGAVDLAERFPVGALTPGGPDMPELGRDQATGGVDFLDHLLPFRQGLAVEDRHLGVVPGGRPLDDRSLGDDQPDITLGPTPIVAGHILRRNAARREGPGHRSHHDAVGHLQGFDLERTEQGVDGHGRLSHDWSPQGGGQGCV